MAEGGGVGDRGEVVGVGAVGGDEAQAVVAQGGVVGAAGHQDDLVAGLGEAAADGSADRVAPMTI